MLPKTLNHLQLPHQVTFQATVYNVGSTERLYLVGAVEELVDLAGVEKGPKNAPIASSTGMVLARPKMME